MTFQVAGIYDNGIVRLDENLPLADQSRVTITVNVPASNQPRKIAQESAGIFKWTGSHEELEQFLGDDNSILESR